MAQNKHLSYNIIPDLDTDWAADPTNENKPFAGTCVQQFIKDELRKCGGYQRMEGSVMQLFHSQDDADAYDANPVGNAAKLLSSTDISGKTNVVFRFAELQPSGGVIYVGASSRTILRIRFTALEVDNEGNETPLEDFVYIAINITRNGVTTTVPLGSIQANTPAGEYAEVNVSQYIGNGVSFTLMAYDDQGNRRTSPRYTVSATMLSVAPRDPNFWAAPYMEGDTNFRIPLTLGWNTACELRATLTRGGTEYARTVVSSAGNMLSTNYPLVLPHPADADNAGDSGIYRLRVELAATDESLTGLSDSFEADLLCLTADDTGSYVIINNVAEEVANYSTARLFDYAAYIGEGNHTLQLAASVDGNTVADTGAMSLETGVVHPFYVSLEEERNDTDPFDVVATGLLDGTLAAFEPIAVEATNTSGYASTGGATLLVKAAGRSNSETNRATMKNLATGSTLTPSYQGMSWSAADGFHATEHTDRMGNETLEMTALRITGGASMTLNEQLLKMNRNEGRTFEILFQPRNVLDEDTPIITIASGDAADETGFVGLKVTSSRVTLLTSGAQDADAQSVGYDSSRPLHLAIVAYPGYSEAEGTPYNACFIYFNGCKQREFAYNRDLNITSPLVCGGQDADLDVFNIRAYDRALTTQEIEANAVNWQLSQEDKADMKARCDIRENSRVNFSKVQALCNAFIFRSTDGTGAIPHFGMSKDDAISGQLRTFWHGNSSWNKTIDCELQGQGTTSMQYWRWNFKAKFKTAVDFDGGTHTAIKKLTAKKNFASSMHSHKMGGTEAYDYLARACGAVEQDAPRQAVWQYPFVGFAEDAQGNLTFIGLYTIGPDKGDDDTFGFVKNKTVSMEGSDNEPLSTNFLTPWNDSTVSADSEGEAYTVGGEKAWEDAMKNTAGVASSWKPAYNLAYESSQNIAPWEGATLDGQTYAATVAGLLAYGQALESAPATEYWIPTGATGAYDLYRYDRQQGGFVRSGAAADMNLASQLCDHGYVVGTDTAGGTATDILLTTALLAVAASDTERNQLFRLARQSKFRQEAPAHWDMRNAFFHMAFVEFFAQTDNLSKNTYPYILDYTMQNARWRWRQDDVDTGWDIDNQGKAKKLYCVEVEDNYQSYGGADMDVFNGRGNQFWLLVRTAFATEYADFMRTVFIPALNIVPELGVLAGTQKFFESYFFSRAQEYFGPALYNADAAYSYESAYGAGSSAYTTHHAIALSQLLGDHYSAEKRWIRLRTVYMMSKYSCGLFTPSATQDVFANRVAAGTNAYTLTPAIYMYPSIANGNTLMRGDRIWPGTQQQSVTFNVTVEGSDQEMKFLGMSYLSSVGNLYEDTFTGALTIYGPMLRELAVGNRDTEGILRSAAVTAISIGSARSLRMLDVSRLIAITGALDLFSCESLRTLYAAGSSVSSLALPDGAPIETLVLPATLQGISLNGLKRLESLTLEGTAAVTAVEMTDCNAYTVSQVLTLLGNSTLLSQLQSLRLAFGTTAADSTVLTDAQITGLIALGESDIAEKQFSGYITKSSGSITATQYNALYAMGIDWAGNIVPDVSLRLMPSAIGVPEEGTDTVQAIATAVPRDAIVTYSISSATGVSIDAQTGLITITPSAVENTSVTVTATATKDGQTATATQTLLIKELTYPTAADISGRARIIEAGAAGAQTYGISFTPSNYDEATVANISYALTGSSVVSLAQSGTGAARIAVVTASSVTDTAQTATLTATISLRNGTTLTATKQIIVQIQQLFVDLGLPSGTLWATGNIVKDGNGNYSIGDDTDYGCYFSWGNIEGHNDGDGYVFNAANYNASPGAALTANIASNDAAHDAALANLGSPWRMPTPANFSELFNSSYTEYIDGNGNAITSLNKMVYIDGVKGILLRSKSNGNTIFFPASGNYQVQVQRGALCYWTSERQNTTNYPMCLRTEGANEEVYTAAVSYPHVGFTVRPVQ